MKFFLQKGLRQRVLVTPSNPAFNINLFFIS
jgi:hypothetical protein